MELEYAVKNALKDAIFLQRVQKCFGLSSSGGFLSFVDNEGSVYCGNVAERILPKVEMKQEQLSFQDYASAAMKNRERYLACYFSTQGRILDASGFVLLSRWTSFADTLEQKAQIRTRLQAQNLDPDVWMHVTGGLPCLEDFVNLNTLRGRYGKVAFIKGYRVPSKQDMFFTVYQQHETMELDELKEVIKMDAQNEPFLPGLKRLYYHKLIGTRDAEGNLYIREESRKPDAQAFS